MKKLLSFYLLLILITFVTNVNAQGFGFATNNPTASGSIRRNINNINFAYIDTNKFQFILWDTIQFSKFNTAFNSGTPLSILWTDGIGVLKKSPISELQVTPSMLSGIMTVAKGGTGLGSPGSNGQFLMSNGTGFYMATPDWLSTSLAASTYFPIPTGSISQYLRGDGTYGTLPVGSVTSVGLSSSDITVGGATSPITSAGNYTLTLPTINSNIGTFNNVTVNAKGQVTAASNASYITGNQSITLSGDVTGSGTTAITTTLANSGVAAGTYNTVTVNAKGIVTAGFSANPTDVTRPVNGTSFRPSTTQNTRVSYTVTSTVGVNLLNLTGSALCYLETSPDNSTWTTKSVVGNSKTLSISITVSISDITYCNFQCEVPTGYYVRLRTVTTGLGSNTITYITGQETTY